jgi:hypothetical protein
MTAQQHSITLLSVIMLCIVLFIAILSVITLNVVAPFFSVIHFHPNLLFVGQARGLSLECPTNYILPKVMSLP